MSYLVEAECVLCKCPGVAKNVLLALANMASDQGHAWPSIDTLCMRLDWGRTAVIEAINWLETSGALRRDTSNGRRTQYWLTPHLYTGPRYPRREPVDPSATRTRSPREPVRRADPTSPPTGPNPSANRTLTSRTTGNSKTPPTPHGGTAPQSADVQQPTSDRFDELALHAYPAHRVNWSAARSRWDELKPDEQLQDLIIRAARAQALQPEWTNEQGRRVPKLSGWLLNRQWQATHRPDAPAAQTAATSKTGTAAAPEPELSDEERAERKRAAEAARERARAMVRESGLMFKGAKA